jgi:hypothetical protein
MAGLGGILAKAVQVSGYLLWEKLARPRVTRASEVPGLPEAITAQWMTDVLCRYRQQLFQGLLMWTPTLCHSPLLPDMQPERVALEMIRRTATAIDDHDSLDCLG